MKRFLWRLWFRVEYGLVRLARALDRLLGPQRSGRMAAALGRLVHRLGLRADVVEDQLRRAYPDRDDAWIRATARGAYEHLGREAMMLIRLSRLGRDAVIDATDVDGLEALRDAMDEGRGAVLVSGHLGNWEVAGAALAARGIPIDAVARAQANPLTDRLINRARERMGMNVVPMGGATKETLRSLREGRAAALVADQDARQRGVFVPFFGRPASTHRGPAVLALRTGAPVFTVFSNRTPDGRYRVRIRRVPLPTAGEEDAERTLIAALMAALEAAVREEPTQYLWHHRRWKTRPPGEREPRGAAGGTGNGAAGRAV